MKRRIIIMIGTILCLMAMWFIPNLAHWRLGVHHEPYNFVEVVFPRYMAVMIVAGMLCEFRRRASFPLKSIFWKRVLTLSILGGLVTGWLITRSFLNQSIWDWVVVSIVMILVGGVQMVITGTIIAVCYLDTPTEKI
mgnify:FL=1